MTRQSKSILAVAISITTLAPNLAWAQREYGYGPNMMWWGNGGGYSMIFGPIFMILILVAVVGAVVFLGRWTGGSGQGQIHHHHLSPPPRTPLEILKERFAKGEIDKNEFQERRKALGE